MSRGNGKGRVPPKEHQFQPGKSGNPKGRPRKRRRAHIPTQMSKDVLEFAAEKVTINTPQGEKEVTIMEAFVRSLGMQAIKGKPFAIKLFWEALRGALHDNVNANPEFLLVDTIPKLLKERGVEMDKFHQDSLVEIASMSMKWS